MRIPAFGRRASMWVAFAVGSLACLQTALAQTPLAHAGRFGWAAMSQATCMNLAMNALQAASSRFDLGITPKAYDGWYAAMDAVDFNAAIHCVADDGSTNVVSATAKRMALSIHVAAARPMNGRDGEIRDFMWNCMYAAPCGGVAGRTGGPRLVQREVNFPQTGQPSGWDWSSRKADTVEECAAICPTYRSRYACKSFFFAPPTGPGQKGRCELHNFDIATGLRVVPAGRSTKLDYYEMN